MAARISEEDLGACREILERHSITDFSIVDFGIKATVPGPIEGSTTMIHILKFGDSPIHGIVKTHDGKCSGEMLPNLAVNFFLQSKSAIRAIQN